MLVQPNGSEQRNLDEQCLRSVCRGEMTFLKGDQVAISSPAQHCVVEYDLEKSTSRTYAGRCGEFRLSVYIGVSANSTYMPFALSLAYDSEGHHLYICL